MTRLLTLTEKQTLLGIARAAVEDAAHGKSPPAVRFSGLPPALQADGASFVTLTRHGELRGCIGTLQAYQPLAADVQEHAVAAATQDFRFMPVQPGELVEIKIEVSRLTTPVPLEYTDPQDLTRKLRPGVDGVILQDGVRRATFLPQVWEQLPDPATFLSHLCQKMGLPAHTWRNSHLQVQIYQVEEFHE